jgi:hypothetical protein
MLKLVLLVTIVLAACVSPRSAKRENPALSVPRFTERDYIELDPLMARIEADEKRQAREQAFLDWEREVLKAYQEMFAALKDMPDDTPVQTRMKGLIRRNQSRNLDLAERHTAMLNDHYLRRVPSEKKHEVVALLTQLLQVFGRIPEDEKQIDAVLAAVHDHEERWQTSFQEQEKPEDKKRIWQELEQMREVEYYAIRARATRDLWHDNVTDAILRHAGEVRHANMSEFDHHLRTKLASFFAKEIDAYIAKRARLRRLLIETEEVSERAKGRTPRKVRMTGNLKQDTDRAHRAAFRKIEYFLEDRRIRGDDAHPDLFPALYWARIGEANADFANTQTTEEFLKQARGERSVISDILKKLRDGVDKERELTEAEIAAIKKQLEKLKKESENN